MPKKNQFVELYTHNVVPVIELFHYTLGTPIPEGWDITVNDSTDELTYLPQAQKCFKRTLKKDKEITFAKFVDSKKIAFVITTSHLTKETVAKTINTVEINTQYHSTVLFYKVFKSHFDHFKAKEINFTFNYCIVKEPSNEKFTLVWFIKKYQLMK